ncbi:hypothetical protein BC827DRAFT_1211818 [Russula dissimulans]|nr:hypothetical protein BC827DRAFT_1211818 [Russula dissimulans]
MCAFLADWNWAWINPVRKDCQPCYTTVPLLRRPLYFPLSCQLCHPLLCDVEGRTFLEGASVPHIHVEYLARHCLCLVAVAVSPPFSVASVLFIYSELAFVWPVSPSFPLYLYCLCILCLLLYHDGPAEETALERHRVIRDRRSVQVTHWKVLSSHSWLTQSWQRFFLLQTGLILILSGPSRLGTRSHRRSERLLDRFW